MKVDSGDGTNGERDNVQFVQFTIALRQEMACRQEVLYLFRQAPIERLPVNFFDQQEISRIFRWLWFMPKIGVD